MAEYTDPPAGPWRATTVRELRAILAGVSDDLDLAEPVVVEYYPRALQRSDSGQWVHVPQIDVYTEPDGK